MKHQRKMLSISLSGDIDLSPILPIVDTPLFQALARRRQLGLAYLLFRDANHSRFSHSLGVYAATLKRAKLWMNMNLISKEDAWNLCLYGLLHDIGHGPYSHVIEPLCHRNHKEVGLSHIAQLETQITKAGGDAEMIANLLRGDNKLRSAVSHGPLGTDKIDYLDRDALYTHISGRPPVKTILHYTYLKNGIITIDPKIIPEVMQLQLFYLHMYQRVYLRKMSLIGQRFFQRIVAELLEPSTGNAPELTEEKLWQLDDGELDGVIHFSQNPVVQQWRRQLSVRELPRIAVSLRHRARDEHAASGKPLTAFSMPTTIMKDLLVMLEDPITLRRLEYTIDELLGLPPHSTLLTPATGSEEAFVPEDIMIQYPDDLRSLEEFNPAHYAALRERASSHPAIFVCVPTTFRERASETGTAREIRDLLLNEL